MMTMNDRVKWIKCYKRNPCPKCGKGKGECSISENGELCFCWHESDGAIKEGRSGGWVHRLKESSYGGGGCRPVPPHLRPGYRPPEDDKPTIAWPAMWIDWDGKTQRKAITEHAEQLGVDPLSLYYLRAVWAEEHQAWAWPMYDGQGKMCGMRLRAVNGEKWAVKHSESGLFVPNGIPVQPRLHLVEGPTDCAAALSIGLYAIGRPSCRGQEKTVCDTVRRLKIKEVVIIADADVPGQEGARRMQEELLVPSVVITPPGKDVREAVADGWNLDQVEAAVKNLVWSIK